MIGSEHLEVRETSIPGARIIVPRAWSDDRGFFKETYVRSKYHALGIADEFVQDSTSTSLRNVLRGLHADPEMSKLVHVLRGEVFDVIVDGRKDSPAFGRWESVRLTSANHMQLYIPAGCLHGFLVLSQDAIFCYKQSAEYAPQREIGVRWDDPSLAIEWPDLGSLPVVSAKDRGNRLFADVFRV
ncbi:MAG TPA: dTDP-4-dehydrorhamnose 3,5-epimerase [Candidatus Baltobacteraceae bacterium]|nr:dTDP-4-dehydrorhamnose 3,5-epimerase [Candidatus Baltobacteraceae bacterium]